MLEIIGLLNNTLLYPISYVLQYDVASTATINVTDNYN